MRGFKTLLFIVSVCICTFPSHAESPNASPGLIGIGMAATTGSDGLIVDYVAAKGPAAAAGIKKGDCVTAIDGVSTRGMSSLVARHSIDGDIGSVVKLSVGQAGSIPKQVSVARRSVRDTYMPAALEGDPRAEYVVGTSYLQGEGVRQSDKDAFAWFYSAAEQDDPEAEYRLGRLYRDGRGVAQNEREAFNWYYRSAENGNGYAAWGVAYLYKDGLGVKADIREALKWYQTAEAALPDNDGLKKTVAGISMEAFLENHDFGELDVSLITAAFRRPIMIAFICLALAYVAGGIVLLYFSLKGSDAAPKVSLAIGWIVFYMESQGVAVLAIFVFGTFLTAEALFVAISAFSALPVLASTLGGRRKRVWKESQVPWKGLLLYGGGACMVTLAMGFGYETAYAVITHAPLPAQPTMMLISKAKYGSAWAAYATIGCILPAAEEVIFRYYLFNALRRRFSGRMVVVMTALAFSLVHFQKVYFVPLLLHGLVLGWVRLRTDSLRLPMLLHAINNGVSLMLLG
jgi:membrane protease YdiL (CAAX protease family)